ncbi:MAG: hypothetical protein A2Z72_07565 [Omnitrophica bacterium RBG_13_46_9]|nr:MAG: hypothetical protein A2Z72_07565 [Omnitrophica bacterium RBG_13_46_9]
MIKTKNVKDSMKIFIIAVIISAFVIPMKDACAIFQLTVGGRDIDFGFMKIGEWKELTDEGYYQNEITCQSDKGNTWYLKVHLLTPFESGENDIEPSRFKWKVVEVVDGNGIITNEGMFNDFSQSPNVVYTSGGDDSNGGEVKVRLSYGLQIPTGQAAGNYRVYLRYTLSETL